MNITNQTKLIFLALFVFSLIFTASILAQDVPEEARKHLARGQAAVEIAKTNSDFEEAVSEFNKAIELAPDWSEAYYQLGVLQDKLGKYDDACKNLKRCLELAPNADNYAKVQELYYKVEYKRDKGNKKKEIITILTSHTYKKKGGNNGGVCVIQDLIKKGEEIKAYIHCMEHNKDEWSHTVPVEFDGSVLKFTYRYYGCNMSPNLKNYPCEWEVKVELTVISTSPLLLKGKELWNRKFNSEYKETYDIEWEFR